MTAELQVERPSRLFGMTSLFHRSRAATSRTFASRLGTCVIALSLLLTCGTASAETPVDAAPAEETTFARGLSDVFRLSGFGTIGIAGSDNERADFVSNMVQPNGVGYTRDWSANVDSRLGIQLTYLPTDKFSAVLQVTAEQEYDNSWDPDVEWAFLQYDLTPNLSVRAGRMVLPIYMFSEFRKVSFALPWVRPPGEFYNVPNHTTDGVGVLYTQHFGELNYTFYGTYGQDNSRFPGMGGGPDPNSKSREAFTLSNTFDYKDSSLRLAYSRVKINLEDIDNLFAVYRGFGPEGEEIYDEFSTDDREISLLALGVWHDPGKWFVGGEWSRQFSETFIQPGDSWYVTGGYRINKFTPYLTYSQTRRSHGSYPQLNPASNPPFLLGAVNDLNTLLVTVVRPIRQSTVSLGTRWNFAENAAFKVQLDHIMTEDNSNSLLTNVQPNFDDGDSVNVLSFTVDFVF